MSQKCAFSSFPVARKRAKSIKRMHRLTFFRKNFRINGSKNKVQFKIMDGLTFPLDIPVIPDYLFDFFKHY